jgi:hypothetical protein
MMHSLHRISFPIALLGSSLLATANANANPTGENTVTSKPRPYKINIDPSFIKETRSKVVSFRPTVDIDAPAWSEGPPSSNITAIAKYWTEEYDWFADQDQINANFSHYIITVPPPGGNYSKNLDIHFIHQRSKRFDATPLLFLHGWPSTSLEWEKVIPSLVDPADDSKPAFHIVAPDLPGFGFSPAPTGPLLGPEEHATIFASLLQQLEYEKYAIYCTDLGAIVGVAMAQAYEDRITNHISEQINVFPNATDLERFAANETTSEETAYIQSTNAFISSHSAYLSLQSTYPLSVAYALNDSPVGFLAWIYQLVYTLSDKPTTVSELIRQTLLLYIPGAYGNIRTYINLADFSKFSPARRSSVPTSVLQFGFKDMVGGYPELKNANYVVSLPFTVLLLSYLRGSAPVYAEINF